MGQAKNVRVYALNIKSIRTGRLHPLVSMFQLSSATLLDILNGGCPIEKRLSVHSWEDAKQMGQIGQVGTLFQTRHTSSIWLVGSSHPEVMSLDGVSPE